MFDGNPEVNTKFKKLLGKMVKQIPEINNLATLSDENFDQLMKLYDRLCKFDAFLSKLESISKRGPRVEKAAAILEKLNFEEIKRSIEIARNAEEALKDVFEDYWDGDE